MPDNKICMECGNFGNPNIKGLAKSFLYKEKVCSLMFEKVTPDLIDGHYWFDEVSCETCRAKGGICGPEGKLWEPREKKPWWKFW